MPNNFRFFSAVHPSVQLPLFYVFFFRFALRSTNKEKIEQNITSETEAVRACKETRVLRISFYCSGTAEFEIKIREVKEPRSYVKLGTKPFALCFGERSFFCLAYPSLDLYTGIRPFIEVTVRELWKLNENKAKRQRQKWKFCNSFRHWSWGCNINQLSYDSRNV